MLNVTYLFGAGASCNCLPTYSNFRQRFGEFYGFINKYINSPAGRITLLAEHQELANHIAELNLEFRFHSTPDTIAKKYYHCFSSTDKLQKLKQIVILFFLYEQSMNIIPKNSDDENTKQTIDKRYDAFIASILKPKRGEIEITQCFNVLTWNYDIQFEIAYLNYIQESILEVQEEIQSFPRISGNSVVHDNNKFSIIHLNGIAYASPISDEDDKIIGKINGDDFDKLNYLLEVYVAMKQSNVKGGENLLSFAWENMKEDFTTNDDFKLSYAKEVAAMTHVLVINGYSFPNFNRVIDSEIIKAMKRLETVYIQSPQGKEIAKIVAEIKAPNQIGKIENLEYWSQFYIPDWTRKNKSEINHGEVTLVHRKDPRTIG